MKKRFIFMCRFIVCLVAMLIIVVITMSTLPLLPVVWLFTGVWWPAPVIQWLATKFPDIFGH